MINEFGVKNFFCFKEWAIASFRFDGNVPKEITHGKTVGTVLGIKGANGSGKTNLLKALDFISNFVRRKAVSPTTGKILVDPHFAEAKEATEFYIDFSIENTNYIYEISILEDKVLSEILYRKKARKIKVFERKRNKLTTIKEYKELERLKLNEKTSIFNYIIGFEFNFVKDEFMDIVDFFKCIAVINVGYTGQFNRELFFDGNLDHFNDITKFYFKNTEAFTFLKEIILSADLGIKDIEIEELQNEKGEFRYIPYFKHEHQGEFFRLHIINESKGTQKLYDEISWYWTALNAGAVLAIDEFDTHLHAMILPRLLELFSDPKINDKHAQFIFTAHNTEIMDILGKYRTILVNKENNESYCYRLDEIPGDMIRNDRPISPLYLQGKIGGVPHYEQ